MVAILAPDRPGDRWCDAQQALFRVHERITVPDVDGAQDLDNIMVRQRSSSILLAWHSLLLRLLERVPLQVRLLVDPTQVGCILGKGGSVITELRRATGASVRVLSKHEVPPCAERGDEMLQVRLLLLARCGERLAWRQPDRAWGRGQVSGEAARVLDALQQVSERLRNCPSRQPIHLARGAQPVCARCGCCTPSAWQLPGRLLCLASAPR